MSQPTPSVRPFRRVGIVSVVIALALAAGAVLVPARPAAAYTTVFYTGAGPSVPHIGLIGDSSLAGVRWNNAYDPLKVFNFTFDAESCRRTTTASCRGRESYAPENAITTLRRLSGQWGSVLVMVTGYNDPGSSFAGSVDIIMHEAVRQGIPHVIWLTMRTADVTYVSPTFQSNSYTFRDNNRILLQKAQQWGGRLQIADWASYSANHPEWFTADGVHATRSGPAAQTAFIAGQARTVLDGTSITPPSPNQPPSVWANVDRGDRGFRVTMVQNALISKGLSFIGGADGVFGQHTEDAVRRFQASIGLPVTGVVDAATAQALGVFAPPGTTPPPRPSGYNVSIGARGITVAAIQRAVMNAGIYLRGGADGIFGQYTRAAVALFQAQRGLPATGIVDNATAQAMGLLSPGATMTPPVPGTWTPVGIGASGTTVQAIQRALINAGIPLVGGADGDFGPRTQEAVITYQTQRGLPATGVVDQATAQAMGLWSPSGQARAAPPAGSTVPTTAPSPTDGPTPAPPSTTTTTTTEVPPPTGSTSTTITSSPPTLAPTTDVEPTTTETDEPETTEPEETDASDVTEATEPEGTDGDEPDDTAPACASTTTTTTLPGATTTTTTTTTIPGSTTTTTTLPPCP